MTHLDLTAQLVGAASARLLRKARDEPLMQGDLDGLCGVYAIINAVRHLCPEVGTRDCTRLFNLMLRSLRAHDTGRLTAATRGLDREQVLMLANLVCTDLFKRDRTPLRVSRPKTTQRRASVAADSAALRWRSRSSDVVSIAPSA